MSLECWTYRSIYRPTRVVSLHLSNAFQHANGHNRSEASSVRQWRCQDSQHSRPEYSKQEQTFTAKLFGEHTARQLSGNIAVEESRKNHTLHVLRPKKRALCIHETATQISIWEKFNNKTQHAWCCKTGLNSEYMRGMRPLWTANQKKLPKYEFKVIMI